MDQRPVYSMVDAAGNVWEWTGSWSHHAHNLRPVCGGSWGYEVDGMRSAIRLRVAPTYRESDIGFRCLRELSTH